MALSLVAITRGAETTFMRGPTDTFWDGGAREAPCKEHGRVMSQNGLRKQTRIDADPSLSQMELIGLTLAANGYRAQEIGERLNVNETEIESVLFSAERKLGAKNRLHAIAKATSKGLIGIEV